MAAMDSSTPPLPLLRAVPTDRPYPLLDLLWGTTLLRGRLCEGGLGVPLRLTLQLLDPAGPGGVRPIERAAVYCWHGDCRGVQITGPDGRVRFDTLHPAPEADGTARLHLQIFLLRAGQVVGVALAHFALPDHTTAQVHGPRLPGACIAGQPFAEAPIGTPVLLAPLPGPPGTGFDAELSLRVVLDGPHTPQRRASDIPASTLV